MTVYGARGAKRPLAGKMNSKTNKMRKAAMKKVGKKKVMTKGYGS